MRQIGLSPSPATAFIRPEIRSLDKILLPNFDRSFWDTDRHIWNRFGKKGGRQRSRSEFLQKFAVVTEELFSPFAIRGEDFEKFGLAGKGRRQLVEVIARSKPRGVTFGAAAKHPAAPFFSEIIDHQLEMSQHDFDSLFECRLGERFTGF